MQKANFSTKTTDLSGKVEEWYNTMPIQFNNLNNLLPTDESKIELCKTLNISLTKLNKWLDPNDKSAPKSDSLIIMRKYFGCSIDYLLDLE